MLIINMITKSICNENVVKVGTCVWARDSQRVGCGASKEPVSRFLIFLHHPLSGNYKVRKKKKKPAEQRATSAPAEKKTSAPRLSNGFVCPGGKLGVWNILVFIFGNFSLQSSSFPTHPSGSHCSATPNGLSEVLHLPGRDYAQRPGMPGWQGLQPDHLGMRRSNQRRRLRDLLQQTRTKETPCPTSSGPGGGDFKS